MLSFSTSHPSPSSCIATAAMLLAFCFDEGSCFIGTAPIRRPSFRLHQQVSDALITEVLELSQEPIDLEQLERSFAPDLTSADETLDGAALKTLDQLTFKDDIKDLIDIEQPYYALKNEHRILDGDETVGFVCTVRREMPLSRELGGISFAEVGRHSAAAATVAAALKNPKRGRHHYLASDYSWDVQPLTPWNDVIDNVLGGNDFPIPISDDDDCTIYCRCNKITKREAQCDIFFHTKDTVWHAQLTMSIVPARTFKMMYSITNDDIQDWSDHNPYHENEIKRSLLQNEKYFGCQDDWVTVEASLPMPRSVDCIGHFYKEGPLATPHSAMLLHNGDLIGKALSKLTGRNIPYKLSSDGNNSSDDWGIKMVNWECKPENLNLANSEGLHLEVRSYLNDDGKMLGESGSKYSVQCLVKGEDSGTISYKSTGTFVLDALN